MKEIPAAGDDLKGAWLGILIGLEPDAPIGDLQVWRQSTASFTELETAMLVDLSRVALAVAERMR